MSVSTTCYSESSGKHIQIKREKNKDSATSHLITALLWCNLKSETQPYTKARPASLSQNVTYSTLHPLPPLTSWHSLTANSNEMYLTRSIKELRILLNDERTKIKLLDFWSYNNTVKLVVSYSLLKSLFTNILNKVNKTEFLWNDPRSSAFLFSLIAIYFTH